MFSLRNCNCTMYTTTLRPFIPSNHCAQCDTFTSQTSLTSLDGATCHFHFCFLFFSRFSRPPYRRKVRLLYISSFNKTNRRLEWPEFVRVRKNSEIMRFRHQYLISHISQHSQVKRMTMISDPLLKYLDNVLKM